MGNVEYIGRRTAKRIPVVPRPADGVVRSVQNPSGYQFTASQRVRRVASAAETLVVITR